MANHLSLRIKKARALHRLTQTQFGTMCDGHYSQVSKWENKINEPNELRREKIERVLLELGC